MALERLKCSPYTHVRNEMSGSNGRCRSRDIFPFLSLPAELRISIYEAALIAPCEIDASFRVPAPQPFLIPGALLRACRQVYHEANDLLYSENTFYVGCRPDEASHGTQWLANIGRKNAKLIRRIAMDIDAPLTPNWAVAFLLFLAKLRRAAHKLEELRLWFGWRSPWQSVLGQEGILRELQNFRGLKKLVLRGGYLPGWAVALSTTCEANGTILELVPQSLCASAQRMNERIYWSGRIRAEAERIRARRKREMIEAWAERKDQDLAAWARSGKDAWREACTCSECIYGRRKGQVLGTENMLSSAGRGKKQTRILASSYQDCESTRIHGTTVQPKTMVRDVPKPVPSGNIIENGGNLVQRYNKVGRETQADEAILFQPALGPDSPVSSNSQKIEPPNLTPNSISPYNSSEKKQLIAPVGYRSLRRETRRWYGKSPSR